MSGDVIINPTLDQLKKKHWQHALHQHPVGNINTVFCFFLFFFWIFMMMKVDHDNARRVCVT